MLTREVPFLLKDGRKAVLRNPKEEDIPGLLDYLIVSAGETDFIMRYPEEVPSTLPKEKLSGSNRIIRRNIP